MAKARRVSTALLVTVLLLSWCFVIVHCNPISGTILNKTLLQESPGGGARVLTTLYPSNVVSVSCRTADTLVFDDPWWLKVKFVYIPPGSSGGSTSATTFLGWVADYDVDCGNIGNCAVPQCP